MSTLIGGEAWDLCYELGQAKTQTQLSSPTNVFVSNSQDLTLMIIRHILVVP
jgi:hypothetical protein